MAYAKGTTATRALLGKASAKPAAAPVKKAAAPAKPAVVAPKPAVSAVKPAASTAKPAASSPKPALVPKVAPAPVKTAAPPSVPGQAKPAYPAPAPSGGVKASTAPVKKNALLPNGPSAVPGVPDRPTPVMMKRYQQRFNTLNQQGRARKNGTAAGGSPSFTLQSNATPAAMAVARLATQSAAGPAKKRTSKRRLTGPTG